MTTVSASFCAPVACSGASLKSSSGGGRVWLRDVQSCCAVPYARRDASRHKRPKIPVPVRALQNVEVEKAAPAVEVFVDARKRADHFIEKAFRHGAGPTVEAPRWSNSPGSAPRPFPIRRGRLLRVVGGVIGGACGPHGLQGGEDGIRPYGRQRHYGRGGEPGDDRAGGGRCSGVNRRASAHVLSARSEIAKLPWFAWLGPPQCC